MISDLKVYKASIADLEKAVAKKDRAKGQVALESARKSLLSYRQLAKIDGEDGGVITIPLGNAEEAGHAGAPLGYVVPAFRGGGQSMDYALRDGIPMMKDGRIRQDYREAIQQENDAKGKKK